MERIAQEFFSMRMMVVALFVFLVSIGLATFAETVYDTQTARLLIYDAQWFMVLLLYLCAGLVANIFRHRMFRAEKISILTFHLAFIVMIIGAAATRFYGFDGIMKIRENGTANFMYSSDPYLIVEVYDGEDESFWEKKLLMSEAFDPTFTEEIPLLKNKNNDIKQNVTLECVGFEKNMVDSLVTRKDIKETALGFAITSTEAEFVTEGSVKMLGQLPLSYEVENPVPGIHVWKDGKKFKMKSSLGLRSLAMTELIALRQSGESPADSLFDVVMPDSIITLEMSKLYNVQGQQFVLKEIKKNTGRKLIKSPIKDAAPDYLHIRLRSKGKVSEVYKIPGGFKRVAEAYEERIKFAGLNFVIGYGSKRIGMPFKVKCVDFRLERYPSSNQPSSYESDLIIIDSIAPNNIKKIKKNLFMNRVVDYKGYRLFQSSYDQDEQGTILSVNNDWWGTNISYLGYLLMGLGMVLALIAPEGRTRELIRKIKKLEEKRSKLSTIALLIALSAGFSASAQEPQVDSVNQEVVEDHTGHDHAEGDHSGHDHASHAQTPPPAQQPEFVKPPKPSKMYLMSEEHSDELASLLVHSEIHKRHMPLHTLCEQLLRKIHRNNTYKGHNSVQVIIGMHMNPSFWTHEQLIYVSSKGDLRKKLGVKKYASYWDLFDEKGDFKLESELEKANRKREVDRSEEEKQLIKLVEKYEIFLNIMSEDWRYLRILPKVGDDNVERWTTIISFTKETEEYKVMFNYFGSLDAATRGKVGYGIVSDNLNKLKALQRSKSKLDLPSESVVNMEITYNKMEVVKRAYQLYGLIGFFLLIFFMIGQLSRGGIAPKWVRIGQTGALTGAILTTMYLGSGLVFRALIAGHVPWSDGYEALLFISLVTVVIGLLLYRKNKVILAAACILAFFLLFVSSLNILDPEITKLQPVLKSYWLKIHVAIITGSYAPLGIGAMLGLINMILYIVRNEGNKERLNLTIKQLTYRTEIVITIGLVMLTIGTFLGGVWANESWGRYWAWDPKETWALVAILAYAILLHLRFIPGVKDGFTFNAVSLWAYATILFTFFGVNFYLVGLHSYANGEGLAEFPTWLSAVGAGFYLFTEYASFKNQIYKSKGESIPTIFFTRKLTILGSLIVLVAIMMMIFKISPIATVATNTGYILALIVVATGVQYLLGGRKANTNSTEILD